MSRLRRTSLWVLVGVSSVVFAENGRGATIVTMIDDFESGAFTLTDTVSGGARLTDAQGSLPVLGGSRDSIVNLNSSGPGASATIAVGSGLGTASLTVASGATRGPDQFRFIYDGLADGLLSSSLHADLTTGGADRFLIDIATTTGSVGLLLTLVDSNGQPFGANVPFAGTGPLEILFASLDPDFGDLTNVTSIQLGLGLRHSASISIASFATAVPEPSLLALLTFSLVAFSRRTARRPVAAQAQQRARASARVRPPVDIPTPTGYP